MSSRLRRWSRGVAVTVAMGGVCVPVSASAQSDSLDELFFLTTSYAVVTGVVAALAVMIPLGLTTTVGSGAMDDKNASMEQYLRQNQSEVREALALGQGPLVDDMSGALGLTPVERAALGRMLRREREVFGALADPTLLTPERAGLFIDHLAASMASDPALSDALERAARRG